MPHTITSSPELPAQLPPAALGLGNPWVLLVLLEFDG